MGAVVDCTDVLRQFVRNHGCEFLLISVPDCLFIVPAFEFQHIQSAVHPRDLMTIVELDSITLDTPLMEAYKDVTSMNGCMSGDFPTLLPGSNAISWTGNVSKVVIQPNWRFL